MLGQSLCTSTFGCYHCQLPIQQWVSVEKKVGAPKIVADMVKDGKLALEKLGPNPKENKEYKDFQKKHKGQIVRAFLQ